MGFITRPSFSPGYLFSKDEGRHRTSFASCKSFYEAPLAMFHELFKDFLVHAEHAPMRCS